MTSWQFVIAPDGQRMQVIRPKNPQLALAIARVALARQDMALMNRLPEEVGIESYTLVGFLGRRGKRTGILDERGNVVGELKAGDSFVSGIVQGAPA